ncbi:MAG TPA: hypothetical protein DCZ61_00390 [Lachnospiraceae bacterium]|nr:hypothetical protein [Lachnospiraceae bacterium]
MSRKSGGSTPGGRIYNRTVCGKSQENSEKWLERSEKSQGSSEKWLERSEKYQKRSGKRLGAAGE